MIVKASAVFALLCGSTWAINNGAHWPVFGKKIDDLPIPSVNSEPILDSNNWHHFTFGPSGVVSPIQFGFNNTTPAVLHLTDAFCRGDSFILLDNGLEILSTPDVMPDACLNPIINPNDAVLDPFMSKGTVVLPSGLHSLQIIPKRSPFNSGGAYLRVDTIYEQCTVGQYTVVQQPDEVGDMNCAEATCNIYGLTLADLNEVNPGDAALALSHCVGLQSQAWVKGTTQLFNGPSCVVLAIGDNVNEAVVGPLGNCVDVRLPSLCVNIPPFMDGAKSALGHNPQSTNNIEKPIRVKPQEVPRKKPVKESAIEYEEKPIKPSKKPRDSRKKSG